MRSPLLLLLFCLLLTSACSTRSPGIGDPVGWGSLDNWTNDNHADALRAFLNSCEKLYQPEWLEVCALARLQDDPDADAAREFFEQHFEVRPVFAEDGATEGLITGYYEPLLNGSLQRSEQYRYPLYGVPDDLLVVDLGSIYPQLQGMRLRGKLAGNRIVPYYDRAQLDDDEQLLEGSELLWVDNLVDVFFLHVQGSGLVELSDGSIVAVGYAEQNGHPYQSIGRVLIDMGELERDEVTLFTIREWLRNNPDRMQAVLGRNPSYIFFQLRDDADTGPVGSLNVPLTARRSMAVDRNVIPLGAPVWLQTTLPDDQASPLNRLMLAQDTGGAIKGHVRADVFWGRGSEAERMAGLMKQPGQLFVLLPRGYVPPAEDSTE